jgi:hypothetical protein
MLGFIAIHRGVKYANNPKNHRGGQKYENEHESASTHIVWSALPLPPKVFCAEIHLLPNQAGSK